MLNDPALRSSRAQKLRGVVSRSLRKSDIIRLLAHGHTEAEIGVRLQIATCTVHAHIRDLFDELDCENRLMLGMVIADAFPTEALDSAA
ncbi:MAG: LuxR C-terminal-related transcriptional regulator [Gemmatimonadales bacterium]